MRLLPMLAALALVLIASPLAGAAAAAAPSDRPACANGAGTTEPVNRPMPGAAVRGPMLVCAAPVDGGCTRPAAPSWRFRADGRPLADWRTGCVHRTDWPGGAHAGPA